MILSNKRGQTSDTFSEASGSVLAAILIATVGVVFLTSIVSLHFGNDDTQVQFDDLTRQLNTLLDKDSDYEVIQRYLFPVQGVLVGFDKGQSIIETTYLELERDSSVDDSEPARINRPQACRNKACMCLFRSKWDIITSESDKAVLSCHTFSDNVRLKQLSKHSYLTRTFQPRQHSITHPDWTTAVDDAYSTVYDLQLSTLGKEEGGRSTLYLEKVTLGDVTYIFLERVSAHTQDFITQRFDHVRAAFGLSLPYLERLRDQNDPEYEKHLIDFILIEQKRKHGLSLSSANLLLAEHDLSPDGDRWLATEALLQAFSHMRDAPVKEQLTLIKDHVGTLQTWSKGLKQNPFVYVNDSHALYNFHRDIRELFIASQREENKVLEREQQRILYALLEEVMHFLIQSDHSTLSYEEKPIFFKETMAGLVKPQLLDANFLSPEEKFASLRRLSSVHGILEGFEQQQGFVQVRLNSVRIALFRVQAEVFADMITQGVDFFSEYLGERQELVNQLAGTYDMINQQQLTEQEAQELVEVTQYVQFHICPFFSDGIEKLCEHEESSAST